MIVGHIGGGGAPYEIVKSLRFRASASARLSRTPSSAGNQRKWTLSCWVKRGSVVDAQGILSARLDGTNGTEIRFDADKITINSVHAGTSRCSVSTVALLRDPSAHFHLVIHWDSDNATASSRVVMWINGVSQPLTFTINVLVNLDSYINRTNVHYIGDNRTLNGKLDGYLSEVHFIDGQNVAHTSFGEFITGAWVPKKYAGLYGTNGFYLPFNDGTSLTTLTQDHSGNENNWTASGVSLTAGVTYDWMDDTPTNNFAVLNSLYTGKSTLSNGNLTASGATDLPTIVPESGTWYFERGGVSQTWTPPAAFPAGSGDYNFGQRPWQSTGPTGGQKSLYTKNLPLPTITKPSEHFQTVLATGANIKTQMDALFSGDVFEWIKDRANSNNHQLMDVSRGLTAVLQSNTTAAETVYSAPAGASVGWGWKAGGAPVANNAGSIPSQVSANVQAGFSIVTYTGTGANATVGHGLGQAPKIVLTKARSVSGQHPVMLHQSANGGAGQNGYLLLDTTGAFGPSSFMWNNTAPTVSVFSVGTDAGSNGNGTTFVAYCFAEIPGFSKISSYTGNGSADGPFVYCGFRPKFVLIKRADSTGNWVLLDSSRAGYNVDNDPLYANLTNAEATTDLLDMTATGFKLRSTNADVNTSGGTYIFYAIAEQSFNAPSNAR